MTDGDLDALELALAVALPETYKAVMRDYPFAEDHEAAEIWLPDDAERVLSFQFKGYRTPTGRAQWPAHYVVIGNDGGEEVFVLDVSRDPSPVFVFELETSCFRPLAPDLAAFIAEIHRWHEEISEDERAMEAGARKREGNPWWRRWWR